MKIEPIETERLRLRGFTPADAMFAIGIWNSPDTGEYLIDEPMEAIDPAYLKEIEVLGEHPDCCYLIAEDKESGTRIGTCSFIPADGVYDLAYCVHKQFWRQGYATEMVGGMIGWAREQGSKKVTILIFSENPGSNAIARKFGFRIAETRTVKKRGTGREFLEYKYELEL